MGSNGELDVSTLVRAAGGAPGQVLEAQTAKQWAWMRSDAAKTGVTLAPEPDDGIPSCYRNLAAQQTAYDQLGYPKAAYPGQSNHGLGTAIDIALTSSVTYWLTANASKYGFVFDVSGEPWHAHRTETINPPAGSEGDEDVKFVTIQGKAGHRNGGVYAIIGETRAVFLGEGGTTADSLTSDQADLLAKVVSGI